MWKIAVGFAVFAAFMMWFLFKTGADVDMGGEKHGMKAPSPSASASVASPNGKAWM